MDNMSETYIKRVELKGIHKRYDLDMTFNESLNVLHGQNGTGKSTLIHIIANIANCDFIRFAFLDFHKIKVSYSNEAYIVVSQIDKNDDKLVKVEADNRESFEFFRREAYEEIRELDDDRFSREYTPELTKKLNNFVKSNNIRHIETSYFPAFRTMLEAWSSQREVRSRHPKMMNSMAPKQATSFSRELFGQFLPTINYPSPIDIEQNLRDEIRECQIKIARYESSVFSDSFVKVFSALLDGSSIDTNTEELLSEISQLTTDSTNTRLGDFQENSKTYRDLQGLVTKSSRTSDLASSAAGALSVYRDALKERLQFQQVAFKEVDKYFEVVNSFLDKKELSYALDKHRRIPKVGLKFPDDTWSSIKVMSSGERQLLTMLYAVNKMSGNSAVLIDEPELSLHIDWQEELLGKMMEQLGNRQIIVCTHSPAIASDFDQYMKEVVPVFNDISSNDIEELDEDEDMF
jgi:predicted ATP-binding protein involved in virulence